MDSTDYLKAPEVRKMLAAARARVLWDADQDPERYRNSLGQWDPRLVKQEADRQVRTLKEDLMYQLPDQYLTEDEIADREAWQQQCASCGRAVEADIAVELDYCSACGHEIERP